MRLAFKPTGQGGQVWRNKRHGLSGEAAQRTLIAAMAGRRVLGRSLVVVDLDAELGGIAKERLKLGWRSPRHRRQRKRAQQTPGGVAAAKS